MSKQNDLVLNILANPQMSIEDFLKVGFSANNTSLEDEKTYLNSETITSNPMFLNLNGEFDETKFHKFYINAAKGMNLINSTPLNFNAVYSKYNVFAPQDQKDMKPLFELVEAPNPDRITKSMLSVGMSGPREYTPAEIAQSQKVYDSETGKWMDTPEDMFSFGKLFNDFSGFISDNFGSSKVLATYDYDEDINGKKRGDIGFDENNIIHYKGQYKLNDNGTYYYRTLKDGENIYGKQLLHYSDILTREGSALNSIDFLDSDDIKKSPLGSFIKDASLIGAMFIPGGVGTAIAGATIFLQAVGLGATLGKIALSSDDTTMNWLEGLAKSSNFMETRSEWSLFDYNGTGRNANWTIENLLGMAGDVVGLLYQQRLLFKYLPAITKGKWGINKENQELLEKQILSNLEKTSASKLDKFTKGTMAYEKARTELSALNQISAASLIETYMKEYYHLGEELSKAYMTMLTVNDIYGEAKEAMGSDFDAALVTMGYAAMEYALLSTDIGKWVLPELRGERLLNKAILKATTKDIRESFAKLGKEAASNEEAKKTYLQEVLNFGKKIFKGEFVSGLGKRASLEGGEGLLKSGAKSLFAGALAEAVEETSEEILADFSKVLYNGLLKLQGKGEEYHMKAFDNIVDRYALSFLGGFIGGGVSSATFDFSEARKNLNMNFNQAMQQLVWKARNNDLDGIYKILDEDEVGNKNLSAFKYDVDEKGERIWKSSESETDSQDYQIKQTVRRMLDMILSTINAHGGNLTDESLIDGLTLRDLRYRALLNSTTSGYYILKYNLLVSELIDNVLLLDVEKSKLKDTDKKDDIDKDVEKNIKIIEERISQLDKEIENFTSGKLAPLYMTSALLETTPYILKPLMAGSFRDYVEKEKHTSFDKVSKSELEDLQILYLNYLNTEKKNDLELATKSYLSLLKLIKSNLEETIKVLKAQESDPLIQEMMLKFFTNLNTLNFENLDDDAWIENLDRLTQETLYGGNIISLLMLLLKNTRTELLEKLNLDKSEFTKALNEEYENIVKQNKEAFEKGLIDEETLNNSNEQAEKDKTKKFEEFVKNNEERIKQSFEKTRDKILIEGQLKQGLELIDKFLKVGYINGAIKDRIFAGLDNILNAIELYSKSIETNDTEQANIKELLELIKSGIISSLEEGGITESRLKDIDYDNNVLKPAIENFKQKIEQLKKLKYTPILLNLDLFALSINGGNISGLLSVLGKMLYSNASNILSFNIAGELYKQLNEAERIILLYISALEGARTDNVDPFRVSITKGFQAEDTSNVWGINKVLNEVHAKAPKLEHDPWEDLPEIEGDNANMMIMDAESILELLLTYKKLYNFNQGLKLNVQTRVATRTTFLLYRRVKDLLSHVKIKKYEEEAQKALSEANLNKLEELTKGDPKDWNLDLSQEETEQIEKERILMEDAIFSFFNTTGLIDDEKSLLELFEENFVLTDDSENSLSENSVSLNDAAFIGYLASKAAIKSTNFHGKFKNTLDGRKAPLISQELHIALTVANVLNGKVVTKIIQAYRNAVINTISKLSYEERLKILGPTYATDAMLPLIINHDFVPQYDNITFVEGIAGSGKTGGVINMSVKLLSSYPEITKNAWVIHGGDKENTTKFGEQLKTDLELNSAKVFNRIAFLKKLSPDYKIPEKDGSYYKYSKDDYSITEDGRIIPTWKLDNNDDVPSIIIIDEAQLFTQLELLLIDKYAKAHGISVITSGDLSQSQTLAKIEFSEEFREKVNEELKSRGNDKYQIPKTIKNEETGETKKNPFEIKLSLSRNQILHAPKLGSSMRTENNQKNKNMISTQVIASNGKGNLELHYYEDDTTLAGDVMIDNPDTKRKQILDYADKIISLGGKINFATYDENSALAQTLKEKYKDSVIIEEGVALGQEGDYWIVELDPTKDGKSFMLDFYTGQTRGRKFTLLIGKPEVKMSGKITFSNVVDQETHKEEYDKSAIKKYAERRKETLNKIIPSSEDIVYIPRDSVKKEEVVSKEPPKKPYESPRVEVDLNKSIYKPGTLIEIYTSEGVKQEDQIYEIKEIYKAPSGKTIIRLENIKDHSTLNKEFEEVVNNPEKFKVLDDTIETIYPKETPSVEDESELEEKAEDSISEVIETERTQLAIKNKLDEATIDDNAEEQKEKHIDPKEKGIENFDIYLFSNATLETGVLNVDTIRGIFEYSDIPGRIDSLNGFKKLLSISKALMIKDIASNMDYWGGLNVIGFVKRALLTIEDKRRQIFNISSILGLDGKECYIRYALKTSELSNGGLSSSPEYGKLEENEKEVLPFELALEKGESTTVQNRKLVAIIGTETNGDIIEIPLLIINNPITLILSTLYEGTNVQSTYANTDGNLYVKLSKIKELYRDLEPGLCNLIDIYLDTDRHVRFVLDENWTPSKMISSGPELNANRGLLNMMGNVDYIQDTRLVDLDTLRSQPDLLVSDVMRFDRMDGTIKDKDENNIKIVSHPKHPFVLYTDLYLTHDNRRLDLTNIVQEFIWQKRNHKPSTIKLVYVLPPKFTLDEYIKSVIDFTINKSKKAPLGNQRTAYKILEALVLTDENGFDNICNNAFGETIGKQVSFKVKNTIRKLKDLSFSEQIKILTGSLEAWNIGRVGIPKEIPLFKLLLNIIKLLVYPASMQIVESDDGGIRLLYDSRGVDRVEEQMALIRPIFEASGTELYYQTVGDTKNTIAESFTPIKVGTSGNIDDDRVLDHKFKIRGDLAPSSFRTNLEFNKFLKEIGKKSRSYKDSGKYNHDGDDDLDTKNYVRGYSGFGVKKSPIRPNSFSSSIKNILSQFGLTTEVKPVSENDESFETIAALAQEINSKNNLYKALIVNGNLLISDGFSEYNNIQFYPILSAETFNGMYYEFKLSHEGKEFDATFDPNTKTLFLLESKSDATNSVEYDFEGWYDDVTKDVVEQNLDKFKELGEKILNEVLLFDLRDELRQAIDNDDIESLVNIFNDADTQTIIANPDYNKNFDLINYVDILKFDLNEENVSCPIVKKINFK